MDKKVFTPEMIAEIEQKHGKVIHIRVFLDEDAKETRECVIKDPRTLPDLTFVASCMDLENSIKRGEYILDNMWVDGHEDFLMNKATLKCNNAQVRMAALLPVNKALQFLKSEVVKH